MTVWSIFADRKGIVIERKRSGWVFVPNGKPGPPRKHRADAYPADPADLPPLDQMRARGIHITRLGLAPK